MSDIANIAGSLGSSRVPVAPIHQSPDRPTSPETAVRHGRGSDAVEISADARRLGAARTNTDHEPDLGRVSRIKSEIAAGNYDNEARFQVAINQLIGGIA